MKKRISVIILLIGAFLVSICWITKSSQETISLETGFVHPPDSIQTSVYWYWLSGNISKEGVIKDLYSMKKAGINRAFIGNIWLNDVPGGTVKVFSDEWWDILHTALKTASDLHIEIGIFNSPGWSQSGGPWIKSEEAMRYLASSVAYVKGPGKISQQLERPKAIFQDVKVIAYPVPKGSLLFLNHKNSKITSLPEVSDLSKITDGDDQTGIRLPDAKDFTIDFETGKVFTARSLVIHSSAIPILANGSLQAKDMNGQYRTISTFEINRSNPQLHVGFDPYAPIVVSFPATTSNHFRIIITGAKPGCGLAEVELYEGPKVANYSEKVLAKMHQTPLPLWKDYQWPKQAAVDDKQTVIDGSKVLDISKYMSADGMLTWNVPEGNWAILRTGMTPTGTVNSPAPPEATGYEVDKMSRKHVEKHFNSFLGEILKRIPASDRSSFKVVVEDSYETGGQNFTDNFLDAFKRIYGYDPVPFLPVYYGMVVNSERSSDRFLWDMRRMVADKVAYDYVGGLREISHKNGLSTWLENYGHWGFPSEFLMYGGQSDEIAGEFWSEGELGNIECRAASSCGHIYGKNKISAESNTCAGNAFSRYPAKIKQRGDRFFAEGINNTLLHVYISQPYEEKNPGVNAWFGNEFNRKNTWFSQMDVYTQYLKRVNFMLQQGLNVADVAYFIGEDAPKMTGITDPALPIGFQFDYMNAEVIEKYMTVKDGLIILPQGTQYKILVLPKLESMRPELLKKIQQLVKDGATILGAAPKYSPSLQNQPFADQQVKAMATELWGNADGKKIKFHRYGRGMVLNGMTMDEALTFIKCIPDCQLPVDSSILYGHRKADHCDIYFLTNQTEETKIITPQFRVKDLQPELWLPATGEMRELSSFKQSGNTISVPLKLAPYESVFIVFRKKAKTPETNDVAINYPQPILVSNVKGPWIVNFDSAARGPAKPIVFDTLSDWSISKDEKIKYYSGTAIYHSNFDFDKVDKNKRVIIDIGTVVAMAKVYVNGVYVGGLWTSPYQLDISKFVKSGNNELKIEVVNTWVNRLIGDAAIPVEQRKTWCPVNPYKGNSPLQSSGLIGPVNVLIE